MPAITVTFENGATAPFEAGIRAGDALAQHARKLAARAIAARVTTQDSRVVDLSRALTEDCRLAAVLPDSPDGLEVLRHSGAHLMAQAILRLFPGTEITIGPVVEHGFYYDVKRPEAFSTDDLARIEETMRAIVKEDLPVRREEMPKAQAMALFKEQGQHYKVEIIEGIPDPVVSLYHQGEFVDLCRGPHLPSTGRMGAFKLTSVAGAYWRGDSRNEQLQRIYGTAWPTQKELDAYLARLEEAKQRDHRRIGQALDLFSIHPVAPGSPFFHPKGAALYNALIDYIRGLYKRYGYTEIITPLVYKTELYKTSGHYELFKDDMFVIGGEDENEEYGVKPMNCPGHCYLFATRKHSYRDLPIRYADFSRLHRFEASGTLQGLTRVRSLAQDDAHIYCTPEQLESELGAFIAMTREVYEAFGFDRVEVTLQTRPEKFLGRVELWDEAERNLRRAAESAGFSVRELSGEGAFYGPKLGFDFKDVLERSWTLSTVQVDCAMPERFGLEYVTAEGTNATPVMIHRAVLGSLERFIAILLEHTAGKLPIWLAPEQVRVLPVSEKVYDFADGVVLQGAAAGLRITADRRNEKLGYKIREAQMEKVPVIAVVGEREAQAGTVAPRTGPGAGEVVEVGEFVARCAAEARIPGGES